GRHLVPSCTFCPERIVRADCSETFVNRIIVRSRGRGGVEEGGSGATAGKPAAAGLEPDRSGAPASGRGHEGSKPWPARPQVVCVSRYSLSAIRYPLSAVRHRLGSYSGGASRKTDR